MRKPATVLITFVLITLLPCLSLSASAYDPLKDLSRSLSQFHSDVSSGLQRVSTTVGSAAASCAPRLMQAATIPLGTAAMLNNLSKISSPLVSTVLKTAPLLGGISMPNNPIRSVAQGISDKANFWFSNDMHDYYTGLYGEGPQAEFHFRAAGAVNTMVSSVTGLNPYKSGAVQDAGVRFNSDFWGAPNVVSKILTGTDFSNPINLQNRSSLPVNGIVDRILYVKPTEYLAFAAIVYSGGQLGVERLGLEMIGGGLTNVALTNGWELLHGRPLQDPASALNTFNQGVGGTAVFAGAFDKAIKTIAPVITKLPIYKKAASVLSEKTSFITNKIWPAADASKYQRIVNLIDNPKEAKLLTDFVSESNFLYSSDCSAVKSVIGNSKPAAFVTLTNEGVERVSAPGMKALLEKSGWEIMDSVSQSTFSQGEKNVIFYNPRLVRQSLVENTGFLKQFIPNTETLLASDGRNCPTVAREYLQVLLKTNEDLIGIPLGFHKDAVKAYIQGARTISLGQMFDTIGEKTGALGLVESSWAYGHMVPVSISGIYNGWKSGASNIVGKEATEKAISMLGWTYIPH
jgi:hypothetical protein